jgi:glycine cleavage system H protein
MGIVRGCEMPDGLYYNVESNVWARLETDGSVTVGMTSYGCSLSGTIVSYTPKKVGKEVKRDKSCATVESGKWVGPVKAPVGGGIIAINPEVSANPGLINEDPYGAGWLVRIMAFDWVGDSTFLLTGAAALDAFAEKMEYEGFGGC